MDSSSNTSQSSNPSLSAVKQTTPEDLLSMYDKESSEKSEGIAAEVERQAKVAEELPKKILANKLVKELNAKEGSSESTGLSEPTNKEEINENVQKDGSQEEIVKEKEQQEVAKLRAKFGEEELEIPEAAQLTAKIGDKEVSFTVADAQKAFLGQEKFNRDAQRRVNYISFKEKELTEQYDNIVNKAQGVVELAAKGQALPALNALVKMAYSAAGKDPIEAERALLDGLTRGIEFYSKLSPEQKQQYYAERAANYAKEQANFYKSQVETRSAQEQTRANVLQLCEQYQLSEDEFGQIYRDILENEVGEGKRWKSPLDIKELDVIQEHLDTQTYRKIYSAQKKVAPNGGISDEDIDKVFDLVSGHEDLTVEDIASIIKEALSTSAPSPAVENLNRKIQQGNSKALQAQIRQASEPKKEGNKEPDADEVEWLYRRKR